MFHSNIEVLRVYQVEGVLSWDPVLIPFLKLLSMQSHSTWISHIAFNHLSEMHPFFYTPPISLLSTFLYISVILSKYELWNVPYLIYCSSAHVPHSTIWLLLILILSPPNNGQTNLLLFQSVYSHLVTSL